MRCTARGETRPLCGIGRVSGIWVWERYRLLGVWVVAVSGRDTPA